jgi:hypothetical protein
MQSVGEEALLEVEPDALDGMCSSLPIVAAKWSRNCCIASVLA